MNTKPHNSNGNNRRSRSGKSEAGGAEAMALAPLMERDYAAMQPEILVEHLTIPGFLRRIDHKWALDDIRRFGNRVGQAAEAMQLAYMQAFDASLGVLRSFPVPLLSRVYTVERKAFGWPPLPGSEPEADDSARLRKELRETERAAVQMRKMIGATENVAMMESLTKSAEHLEAEVVRLRERLRGPAEPLPKAAD